MRQKKVAAYCRVSSEHEKQGVSLEFQIEYYNVYIHSRSDWRFVGIYTETATGMRISERPEFQRMIEDCRKGKIDLILTKPMSRNIKFGIRKRMRSGKVCLNCERFLI